MLLNRLSRFAQGVSFVRAIAWLFVVGPSVLTWLLGYLEGRPWSTIVALTTVTLGGGAMLAWGVIKLLDIVNAHISDRTTKNRIWKQIDNYMKAGGTEIDTVTAAGIWAGTMDLGDAQRHVYFRMLKLAIDTGKIKGCRYPDGSKKANKLTHMSFEQYISYLKSQGALD